MPPAATSELALFAHELGSYSEPWIRAGNSIAEIVGEPPVDVKQLVGEHQPTDIDALFAQWRDRLDTPQLKKIEAYDDLQLAFEEYEPVFRGTFRAIRYRLDYPTGVSFLAAGSFANVFLYDPPNDTPKVLKSPISFHLFDALLRAGAYVHTQDLPTTEKGIAVNFHGETVAEYIPGTRIERVGLGDIDVTHEDLQQIVVDAKCADGRQVGVDATGKGNILFTPNTEHRLHLIDLGGVGGRGLVHQPGSNLTSLARSLLLFGDMTHSDSDFLPQAKKVAQDLLAVCTELYGNNSEEAQKVHSFIERHQGPSGKRTIKKREFLS